MPLVVLCLNTNVAGVVEKSMLRAQFKEWGPSMPRVVYVVDDEHVISASLAAILTNMGFDAVPFSNPLEALKATESKLPDILISDVMMPELNGIELAIRFKTLCPSCKVVLFSGQASTSDMLEQARQDGHNFTLLSKPVHPSDLLAALSPA